ncbi:NADPH-dependent oxidoreductase [Calothrix sp. 336/3]|uniref:NADPH-dependent oxidoreductase n=1 Tax=Calothrix sp. 336/3 TaxID=1337936 RepID=UPI0004E2A31D|nr:NADPH-dependent oxidoreductase [Calothrix sp. 336/3]AKG21413.1 nitroreductase [Calothrix sp. 336/3]
MTNPQELLHARYGEIPFQLEKNAISWNQSVTALLSHRSIRSYLPNPLPDGTLELMISSAQSAATSSNLQTWSVVAVEDKERKEELSKLAGNQAHIRQCPLFLVWLADLARLAYVAESRGFSHDGLEYLEMFVMATIDATLAAQNAVVAAESFGLGTVYIGGIRNRPEEVAAILNLPPSVFAVFGLCVGYPNPEVETAIKPRLPQSAVLHRETYNLAVQAEALSHYDEIMKAFYQQQKMNVPGDWSEHSAKRIATSESLSGRNRLREALNNLGFELR